MLFFIIIILFIILNLYFIFNLYLIDENCSLKPVTNKLNLKIGLHNKNPILINIPSESTYDNLLSDLKPSYKNQKLFNEHNLSINYDHNLLNSKITCNMIKSLSCYDKKDSVSLLRCKNNFNIISNLIGDEYFVYLFHPKHRDLIQNKNIEDISKYGEKVLIKPFDILYIPFGWFYYQEINKPTVLYNIEFDNYFTYIHNTILNKF
jgi:hypothetical protein